MIDIKFSFVVSFALHFLFFLSLSCLSKSHTKIYYIPVQVISSSYGGHISESGNDIGGVKEKLQASLKQNAKEDVVKPGDITAGQVSRKKKKAPLTKKKNATSVKKNNGHINTAKTVKKEADAGGVGGGVAGGRAANMVGVDAGNFPYLGYVNILRNKVAQNWNPSPYPSASSKKVLVYFRILKNGKTDNLIIKESAGVSFIDRSAIRAIMSSSPFPPLPPGYTDDYLGVYFMFEVTGGGS